MSGWQPLDVLPWIMVIGATGCVVAALQVLGFKSHRARIYNCYIILSMMVLALSGIRTLTGTRESDWYSVVAWGNWAFGIWLGAALMVFLAFRDRKPTA